MSYYLGIDLGGTNIAAGVVDERYRIVSRAGVKTKAFYPAEEICDDMVLAAREALEQAGLAMSDLRWAGVGAPGPVVPGTGVVAFADNLGFVDTPLRAMMEERLGARVFVANDANAAAYGEALAGAGRGVDNLLMMTLGTGVGGGVLIDGRMLCSREGFGGEIGHMGIQLDGRPCSCGRRGCIEAYASATALIEQTHEAMRLHPESRLWELAGCPEQVSGKTAFDAMRLGDAAGAAVVERYVEYIAYSIVNYINTFAPDLIIIGGGVSREGEPFLERIRAAVAKQAHPGPTPTRIECAQCGNDAGIIGAALWGRLEPQA